MGFKLEQQVTSPATTTSQKGGLEGLLKKEITLFGTFFNTKRKEDFYSELAVLLNAGIAAVSILTAPLGARLAHSLPVGKLKKIFALLLIVVGTRMLISIF